MSSRSATLTASRIFLSSTTTTAPESIATVTALTTYTSYTISTFVSSGTTYTQSEGHPVIVTDSAEFSSLSAAGAFQTASSSSTASTSSQTVRGKKGTKRPPGSKPLIRLQATSSTPANAGHSTAASQGTRIGPGAGAGIGIAGVILLLGLIAAIVWYLRRWRRMRQERQLLGPEMEVKPQLEDTSTAWKDNIHAYKRELSAAQEVHELDAETGRVLAPELRAGPYSNRHEMEGSLERLQTTL
jgi:hypothetical protein